MHNPYEVGTCYLNKMTQIKTWSYCTLKLFIQINQDSLALTMAFYALALKQISSSAIGCNTALILRLCIPIP